MEFSKSTCTSLSVVVKYNTISGRFRFLNPNQSAWSRRSSNMRCSRVVLTAVLSTFAMVAFAQSDVGQKSPQSDAQKSFEKLKTLAGSWDGTLTTTPPSPEVQNKHAQVTLRVTSMGNAFLHEIKIDGRKD